MCKIDAEDSHTHKQKLLAAVNELSQHYQNKYDELFDHTDFCK